MKKKNKKNKKFKELDYNFEEYDEEKEKEEIDEVLRLLQKTFSLSDDEMTKLLNYDFEDEDLKDIDRLVSILLNIYSKKEEEKKEPKKPANNENINQEKGNKLDIEPRTKLQDLIYSIEHEQKNNENKIDDDYKPKNLNHRPIKVVNFNVKKAKEFLKVNGTKTEIDLHGFTLVQSMYIIDKKLESLTDKKCNEKLQKITLTIITGVGNHSPDHKPVLHPQLTKYLKDIRKISVDEKSQQGAIFVTIY